MSKPASVADAMASSVLPMKGVASAPQDAEKGVRARPVRPPRPPKPKAKATPAPAPEKAPAPAPVARKRPWDAKDELKQVSHRWPERITIKLNYMKVAGQIEGAAEFSAKAVEEAIDKVIAEYDKAQEAP